MTKEEFLYELKKELSALDSAEAMAYNLRYYSDYIDAEIAKGRSEQEVLDELGNPRWLVNSIKESGDYGRVQDIIEGPLENVRSNDEEDTYCECCYSRTATFRNTTGTLNVCCQR